MSFWVFVGRSTGMPYAVEKCTFRPYFNPDNVSGDWVEMAPRKEVDTKAKELELATHVCELADSIFAENGMWESCSHFSIAGAFEEALAKWRKLPKKQR